MGVPYQACCYSWCIYDTVYIPDGTHGPGIAILHSDLWIESGTVSFSVTITDS